MDLESRFQSHILNSCGWKILHGPAEVEVAWESAITLLFSKQQWSVKSSSSELCYTSVLQKLVPVQALRPRG
eukprot:7650393-Karenia_brevis.AAC.1